MYKFGVGYGWPCVRVAIKSTSAIFFAVLAGCASQNYSERQASVPPPQRLAAPVVEMESDGLPTQTPPLANRVALPVDASEPFSPDYGGYNPAQKTPEPVHDAPVKVSAANIPEDLPVAFRQKLLASLVEPE